MSCVSVSLVGLEEAPTAASVLSIPSSQIQVLQHVPGANGIQLPVNEVQSPNSIASATRHFESTERASR